jgi:tetratricopeptide (TPR) repeat protein
MHFITKSIFVALLITFFSCGNKKEKSNNMPPLTELTYSSELQLSSLNEAIETDPNNDYLYFKRADYFFGINNFRIAQNDISKALRLDGSISDYWLLSAKINNELENVDFALSEAQKALELGNTEPILYALLANCLLEKNDTISANQYIAKLSSIAPQMAELNYIEAKKSILRKDTAQTFLKYKSCIQKNPQYIEAYIDLMSLYYAKHMYDSIMPLLIKAQRMRPCKPELFLYEGKFFESIQKENVALAAYKEGLLCDPQAIVLYKPLSEYYQKKQNYKEAIAYLSKWLERNPLDTKSIIKMGDYSLKLEDNRGAIIYYKNALSIDTSVVYIKKEIDRIEKMIEAKSEVISE